jgi:hypothetical protein
MPAALRLPGVRFETVTPPATPALPRMDVAAFAGFAASGPVGVPVAVDDAPRFAEIFGGELPLAWDAERGERARAHLAPAVREFFRNGGRRCWVVRLAEGAESARFLLPGVLRARGGAVRGAAWMTAGSPGSWADGFGASATLLRTGLAEGQAVAEEEGVRLLRPGVADLLRVDAGDTVGFFPPPAASRAADRTPEERERARLRPVASSYWFRREPPDGLAGAPPAVTVLGAGTLTELPPSSWAVGEDGALRVAFDDAGSAGVRPGSWLRAELPDAASPPGRPTVYLLVDAVLRGGGERTAVVHRAWRALEPAAAWAGVPRGASPPAEGVAFSLVSLELWARRTTGSLLRVADVALAPGHPRWIGGFPTDAALAAPAEQLVEAPHAALRAQLATPRFPFAAPDPPADDVFLPLGAAALPREEWWQPAEISDRSALERDGLARFDADLFLDAELRRYPADSLLDAAFFRQYQQEPGQPPARLHALLGVEEASILAVPDAVHPGWTLRDGAANAPEPALAAPEITGVGEPDDEGCITVRWTAVEGATGYRLEGSLDARFRREVSAATTTGDDAEPTGARIRAPSPCPAWFWLRVRAEGLRGPGMWSETRLVDLPPHRFHDCDAAPLPAPTLRLLPPAGSPPGETDRLELEWSGPGERFLLVAADEPSFAVPTTLYEGPALGFALWVPTGAAYFRVAAAAGGSESPWSATAAYEPAPRPRWEVLRRDEADGALLLTLHEAMLRLCAARSDITAVLSLPSWHREEEAVRHATTLTARLGGVAEPGDAGARTLSFGALYHPWTWVRAPDAGAPLRAVPPEGAVCGVMAARSREQGAWTVPANRVFAGVAALEPSLGEGAQVAVFGRKVNLVVPSPRGFVCWSEETLSDDPELLGVGVRRLLILLRRLALREGFRYVFQPNDAAFRRLIQRQWDRLLADLFARGAFAGATRDQGFRVVTGESVNPRQSVEQGRFVVELRVAPSRPLHFLTVRLVQTGTGITLAES